MNICYGFVLVILAIVLGSVFIRSSYFSRIEEYEEWKENHEKAG